MDAEPTAREVEWAREYCQRIGLNPDELVGHGREGGGAWYHSPRWMLALEQVRAARVMHQLMLDMDAIPTPAGRAPR